MPNPVKHKLTKELEGQITELVTNFAAGTIEINAETLLSELMDLLPIEKMNRETLFRRITGYSLASEMLWDKALQMGDLDRSQIIKKAKIRSMSYYHYMTGSGAPASMVETRADLYNDPPTALAKLKDDIIGLAKLIPEFRSITTA